MYRHNGANWCTNSGGEKQTENKRVYGIILRNASPIQFKENNRIISVKVKSSLIDRKVHKNFRCIYEVDESTIKLLLKKIQNRCWRSTGPRRWILPGSKRMDYSSDGNGQRYSIIPNIYND